LIDAEPSPAKVILRLCNFVTGSAALQGTHQSELHGRIIAAAWPHDSGFIDIVGFASKLGDNKRNHTLSVARCSSVKRFLGPSLDSLGQRFRFNVVMGKGEEDSQNDPTGNNGFFRAVVVKLFAQGQYKYEPPKVVPKPKLTEPAFHFEFKAIQVSSANIKVGQADFVEFSIRDVKNSRIRHFQYIGGGGNIPTPGPPVGVGVGRNSNVVGFSTDIAVNDFEDFAGSGTLRQESGASLGNKSVGGECKLSWTPAAYERRGIDKKITVHFSTSKGFGFGGGSGSTGQIIALPANHRPRVFPGE
jgi:hypothetical protein